MRRSRRFHRLRSALVLAAIAATAAATPALATTYVPVSDQALIERAAVIGTFEVISSEPAPTATVATEYRVLVETLLKGDLPGSTALVRVPGGVSRAGDGLRLSGLPSFQPGERGVLLFLVPRSDGAWGIAHVILGAFHALERREGDLLVRPHLAEARSVGGARPERRRRRHRSRSGAVSGLDRGSGRRPRSAARLLRRRSTPPRWRPASPSSETRTPVSRCAGSTSTTEAPWCGARRTRGLPATPTMGWRRCRPDWRRGPT